MSERRRRRTDREMFLDRLADLSKETSSIISGGVLRGELRWQKAKYNRIKQGLLKDGVVKTGRARGGGIGLIKPTKKSGGLRVFISYSHADKRLMNDLRKHLEPLRQMGLIRDWHDGEITPGKEWAQEISDQLGSAEIILLLISIDFINSQFCTEVELKEALQRHQRGKATVIPIILRNCLWKDILGELEALPTGAKAVTAWGNDDEALTDVAQGVERAARERLGVAKAAATSAG
jgi:hypothetical protein